MQSPGYIVQVFIGKNEKKNGNILQKRYFFILNS